MAKRRKNTKTQEGEEFKAAIILTVFLSFLSLLTGIPPLPIFVFFFGIIGATALYIWRMYQKDKRDREYQEKIRNSGIHEIDKMSGSEFEYFLKELFSKYGYKAKVTKASGDFGADLILEKGSERIVVQAKRHSKNIGKGAVQEASSAMMYYSATEGWVVTNSRFTAHAIELAKKSNVRLMPREVLIELMYKIKEESEQNVSSV